MGIIKSFENFYSSAKTGLYVATSEGEELIENFSLNTSDEGYFYGNSVLEAVSFLESKGFSSPNEFILVENLNESLDVRYEGHKSTPKGTEIFVTINGHRYGYTQKEGDLDIGDIARKFEKMLQFSAGKALSWLKKHTTLTSGSKSTEEKDVDSVKEGFHEIDHSDKEKTNYMFFQNLNTIQKCVEKMLAMDQHEVDSLISDGHDWANDHISTSKDDVEEVCNWLCNKIEKK